MSGHLTHSSQRAQMFQLSFYLPLKLHILSNPFPSKPSILFSCLRNRSTVSLTIPLGDWVCFQCLFRAIQLIMSHVDVNKNKRLAELVALNLVSSRDFEARKPSKVQYWFLTIILHTVNLNAAITAKKACQGIQIDT